MPGSLALLGESWCQGRLHLIVPLRDRLHQSQSQVLIWLSLGIPKIPSSGFLDVCTYTHGRQSMPSQLIGIEYPFFRRICPQFVSMSTLNGSLLCLGRRHTRLWTLGRRLYRVHCYSHYFLCCNTIFLFHSSFFFWMHLVLIQLQINLVVI